MDLLLRIALGWAGNLLALWVASLLIDVAGACLRPGQPVALDLKTDGPAVVRFSDGRAPVAVRAQ